MLAPDAASPLRRGRRTGSRRVAWAEVAWAETVLREQDMPADELRVVLTSSDRELIRHHLELHLERLDERLVSQKQDVEAIGRILGGRLAAPPVVPSARRTEPW
jgi:hypothetical protein